ncbi:hypothetical protein H2200_005195 [Cladophialophora chaetospira]|uniref:Uncharacterized protein n=1 Tax=Cladophialophora chaetospira TaxID=386627 RepID=A0AA38XBI5_9EURO|nr:hypothetical protein H2200_005195 [Cladophialophora chaetospira]
MAVTDSTAFYLALANAAVFFNQITLGKGSEHSDFEESAKYVGICLSQITARLKRELNNISEGVVVTVLGFLCHDSTVGRWDRFAMHMNGLQNMLRLRGDFKRHDSIIAMFASCLNDSSLPQGVLSPPLQRLVLRLSHRSYAYAQIATALEASARLADCVNENAHNAEFWKDAATTAKLMTPITHLLLSMPRLSDCNAASSEYPGLLHAELSRLAMLMLLARLKQAFSLISEETRALGNHYSTLIHTAPCFDDRFSELALWAHITVAIVEQAQSRKMHVDAISMMMKTLGIQNSGEAIQRAKRLVWIDVLMEPGVAPLEVEVERAHRDFLIPQ